MSKFKAGDTIFIKNNYEAIRHMNWDYYKNEKYKILAILSKDYSGFGNIIIDIHDYFGWVIGSNCWNSRINELEDLEIIDDLKLTNPDTKCYWIHEDLIELDGESNNSISYDRDDGGLSLL
jgi:hypothetical protein